MIGGSSLDGAAPHDRLRRLNNSHAQFLKRVREEEAALTAEREKWAWAQEELDEKHSTVVKRLRSLEAFNSLHQLKQTNLRHDIRESTNKVAQIQAKLEAHQREVLQADQAKRAELQSLQALQRELESQISSTAEDRARIAEASLQWDDSNSRAVRECDAARQWTFDAFVKWLRFFPLLYMHSVTDEALLLSHQRTASCQGLVAEWTALRSLLDSFTQVCRDYTPVEEDCGALLPAQLEKLRHLNRFTQVLQERAQDSRRSAERLSESIRLLEALRASLRGLSTDLCAALEADLQSAQQDAQEDAMRPLSSSSLSSSSSSSSSSSPNSSGPRELRVESLRAWQWCRHTEIVYSPELDAIQAALNAEETDDLFFEADQGADEEADKAVQRGGSRAKAVLLGLESRRLARDLQWASTLTAHEAVRKITQAISHQDSRDPLLLSGTLLQAGGAAVPPADETLERFFGWCEYLPMAAHLSLALDCHSFPCAPGLLAQRASEVLPALAEAERAELALAASRGLSFYHPHPNDG